MARMEGRFLALVLLASLPFAGFATPSTFAERLLEADNARGNDRQRFQVLLEELEGAQEGMDLSQVQYFQFLKAFDNVIYRNKVGKGIAQAKVLMNQAVEQDLRFRAGTFLTNALGATREFGDGLRVLNQILPMRAEVRNDEWRNIGLNGVALFYTELGKPELALQYANEVLQSAPTGDIHCVAGISVLEARYRLGTLPVDDALFHEGIAQCLAANSTMAANFKRLLLARRWSERGDRDRAIELLEMHTAEVEAIGYFRQIADFHALLAQLKLEKGDLKAAEAHARAATEVEGPLQNLSSLAAANKVLFQIAEFSGNSVDALVYFRRHAKADKEYLNEVNARELAFETVRNEVLENNQKIQLLSQQNEVLQLQQRVQKQSTQNMGLVVVLLALLLAVIWYWAFKVKRLHVTLRHFAESDTLTGISNRRHFTQQAQRSLEQCQLAGESAALIMFDLDRFKAINDTHGREAGDRILERVAASCKGLCRDIDRFGRISGDEFAILLRGCELDAAVRLAEDCRVRLSDIDTRASGHAFPMTASFGVTSTVLSGYSLSAMMSHADLMLYRAKREGRNMVRAYGNDLPAASASAGSVASSAIRVASNSASVVVLEAAREVLPAQEPAPERRTS